MAAMVWERAGRGGLISLFIFFCLFLSFAGKLWRDSNIFFVLMKLSWAWLEVNWHPAVGPAPEMGGGQLHPRQEMSDAATMVAWALASADAVPGTLLKRKIRRQGSWGGRCSCTLWSTRCTCLWRRWRIEGARQPETLSPEVMEKMQVMTKDPAVLARAQGSQQGAVCVPDQDDIAVVLEGDASLLGLHKLSLGKQRLAGKPRGFFISTGTHGRQETNM